MTVHRHVPPGGSARRWLVTGAHGMLGRDLVEALTARGALVTAAGRDTVDITDPEAASAAVAGHDVVVNAAAWTDVDGAETHEAAATRINATGPGNLAAACAATGARLLQLSTDYVFGGDATTPYPEDATPKPVSAYGRGKLAGERAVLQRLPDSGYVVRTAWLYGTHGRNFPTTMLRLAAQREHLSVVADQRGQPTWSHALAEGLAALGEAALAGTAPAGVYHASAAGETTWYGLARALFAEAGLDPDRIRPITTEEYPLPARRPAYSVLGHARWAAVGLPPLADWRSMLRSWLALNRTPAGD